MKRFAFTFAMLAIFGLTGLAQRPDPIETAKAGQKIADQKAELEVRKALDDADRTRPGWLSTTSPAGPV